MSASAGGMQLIEKGTTVREQQQFVLSAADRALLKTLRARATA